MSSVIHEAHAELADELNGLGFKVVREQARADNSYICKFLHLAASIPRTPLPTTTIANNDIPRPITPPSHAGNETNWRGLVAVGESQETGGRLKASFFVHIPYASPEHGDHATLARALSVVIGKLVAVSAEMAADR